MILEQAGELPVTEVDPCRRWCPQPPCPCTGLLGASDEVARVVLPPRDMTSAGSRGVHVSRSVRTRRISMSARWVDADPVGTRGTALGTCRDVGDG